MGEYAGFCVLVFVGTGALFGASWVFSKIRGAMRAVDDAIDLLDCGCARKDAPAIYWCMNCGHDRCREHRDPHECPPDPVDEHLESTVRDDVPEEDSDTAADFLLWADELATRPGVRKHMRRMDRRSQ